MSTAVPIPKRKQPLRNSTASTYSSWSSSASASSSYSSPVAPVTTTANTNTLSKAKAIPSSPADEARQAEVISPRRPSLLGQSLSKSEYTVINLSHSDDGPQRLVTCVKSSQGFDWNQELFLPSYAAYDSQDLEHKRDPVEDIILTDEEAAAMLPQ